MSSISRAGALFGVMLVLLALRVPIGIAMCCSPVGAGGYVWAERWRVDAAAQLAEGPGYAISSNHTRCHPLFLLMGQFATYYGCRALFRFVAAFMGHRAAAWRWRRWAPAQVSARSAVRRSPPRPP